MTNDHQRVVRSYQRIFTPQRRIYEIEGHRLPIPGGIPLAWLAYATATLLTVLLLSGGTPTLAILLGVTTAGAAHLTGIGRARAFFVGGVVAVAVLLVGVVLGAVDWPLRLLVVPALVATLMTQATPDGRPMHRYLRSTGALRLRAGRRSLGRPLFPAAASRPGRVWFWVARDHRTAGLRRGRVHGPATVFFDQPVATRVRRWRGSRRVRARPCHDEGAGETVVVLGEGERLELLP